ncbi:MAG: ABC transporter permease [Bacteroidota bacterium]
MFKNYIKIAWRKIKSQRFYAIINILGLAISIACCLLITLFVIDEWSYDRFHEKADRIHRITLDLQVNSELQEFAVTTPRFKEVIVSEIPEIETAARFRVEDQRLMRRAGTVQNLREEKLAYADPEIFDIFTLPLVYGDDAQALQEPNTIVLSRSAAERHFGTMNPVGETILLSNEESYRVDGIFEDLPTNSHFHYDVLLSAKSIEGIDQEIWLSNNYLTYFLTKPNVDESVIETKINDIFHRYAGAQMNKFNGGKDAYAEFEAAGNFFQHGTQALTDIHLSGNLDGEHEANSRLTYVWLFSAIALFILLIACINFMNLSTARSANRAREVGMRKVLGSLRSQLIGQFLAESILMSMIAFLLAIAISQTVMPAFNDLTGKTLHIPFLNPLFLGSLLIGILFVGILAGTYPAFFLSAFDPLKTMKGKIQQGIKSGWLRRTLVTSQFSISIILMIGTGVIYSQLKYIQSKQLGFEKEQVIMLNAFEYPGNFDALEEQLSNFPEVVSTTVSCYLPVPEGICTNNLYFWEEGKNSTTEGLQMQWWKGDHDYASTLDMELAAGRFFDQNYATDSVAVVLNEAAVKAFNLENPVGSRLRYSGEKVPLKVIGVLKDFNFNSLRSEVTPLCFTLETNANSVIVMRVAARTDMRPFIQKVEKLWSENAPSQPLDYAFLDERVERAYESEERLGSLFLLFAGLAIFIACLGLFALVAFTAERRRKEISIRKTLGASVSNIVTLLSKEFLLLVGLALVISIPIAYYFMDGWLQDFAYRIELEWWVFALAGLAAIGIALLTVSVQSVKAALANPVKSLRSE